MHRKTMEPKNPTPWTTITFDELTTMLTAMEELQAQKVLDLARRLRPGLTAEDIRNPHDFPDLNDPDWHYADGILTGVQSVGNALRALERDRAAAHETQDDERGTP